MDRDNPLEVPTLHVLFYRPIGPTLGPTLYPLPIDEVNNDEPSIIREELISWVAEEGLAGDRDAAEWILLMAIARVSVTLLLKNSYV